MPTVEGLQKIANLNKTYTDQAFQMSDRLNKQDAAKKAADQYKSGDVQGAYATMMQASPDWAEKMIGQGADRNPNLQGDLTNAKMGGQLGAQDDYGSTPRELTDAQGEWALKAAGLRAKTASMGRPRVAPDKNSPTGFSLLNPADGSVIPVEGYGLPAGASPAQQSGDQGQKAQQPQQQPLKLRSNEEIDSTGNKVMLSPRQLDDIKNIQKQFTTSQKDNIKAIQELDAADSMIKANTPGSGTTEKLRILKGVVQGRISQQEFAAFGNGMGVGTVIENAASEAAGKGMSAQTQKNLQSIVDLAKRKATGEFDAGLQNTLDTAPSGLDRMILKKRLMGSGPTAYQQTLNKVNSLPPEDQAAINWAHDNPNDPRAQKILQQFGNK